MFVSVLRLGFHGICDPAEILLRLIGAEVRLINNVNIIKCGKRPYHNNLKRTLFPQVNTCYGKNNIQLSTIKYSTENVQSAIPIQNSYENRSTQFQQFLEKHNIQVSGKNISDPYYSIEDAKFPESILSVLRKCNINEPTPIQSLSWPNCLDGRDFVGVSKTGSGKTLSYIIPAIIHIEKLKSKKLGKNFPLALVVVPTRELALQIENVVRLFRHISFRCVCLYGGNSKLRQLREVEYGIDLCIATPGRMLDILESGALSLNQCSFLVLDEADRMLDMGFLPDIEKIIHRIECKKQVLMWSATWPKEVKNVAQKFLSDYVMITVGSTELKPNENIRQIVKFVPGQDKRQKLVELLHDLHSEEVNHKVLIFAETKFEVNNLEHFLHRNRVTASAIHSGKSQMARQNIMRGFRNGKCSILIATAVAARGLDIDDITHVINYDCPKYIDEYIHKIGRTARHEKTGTAITFVTSADTYSGYLLDLMKQSNEEIPKELFSIGRDRQVSFNATPKKFNKGNNFFGRSRRNHYY